jgi:hypothetical protein
MVQIIVDNEALDLTEAPVMSFQVADISDIESRQGDFTYEFEVPATQRNRKLLRRSHTIFGSPYEYIEAWFRTSADVKKGFIQVMEYKDRFRVNFFSGNANWIALIGDKMLSDLNLSVWDHTYDVATIVASFSNTEGYIYPLIRAYSGPDREAFAGLLADVQFNSVEGYIEWDDLSGDFYNQGLYESPFYTLDGDYNLSISLKVVVQSFSGTSAPLTIVKKALGGYIGLTSVNITSTGTYVLRLSTTLLENDAIGIYLDTTGGENITIDSDGSYVFFSTSFTDLENIDIKDLFPAVYVHSIIKQIFQEISFKLAGSFLQNADYRRMIVPFSGTVFARSGGFVIERSIYLGLAAPVTVTDQTVIFDDEASPFFVCDLYISPRYYANGNYTVKVEALITADAQTSSSTDLMIYKNSVAQDTETFTGNPYVELYAEFAVTAGDVIEIFADSTGGDLTIGADSWWKITADPLVGEDEDVTTSLVVPEMKQIDLIKYVFVSLGVIPVVDDFSKTLTLTEFRSVKQKTPEDWSSKLAGKYEIDFYEFSNKYGKRNDFKYQENDEDKNLDNYLSRNNSGYGDGKIQLDNVFLTGDTTVFESDFLPVWFDEFTINEKTAHLSEFIRDKKPRILFVVPDALIADFSDFSEILVEDNAYSLTHIAWAYFTKYKLGSDLDQFDTNLSYTMPEILNGNGHGILSKYWDDYAGILNRPKMLIAPFKLSLKDIIDLDYTRRKYVEGENITGYYFLNKIRDYDFDGGIAECELMLIDNLDITDQVLLLQEQGTDNLLLEDGFDYLYETGDLILLE